MYLNVNNILNKYVYLGIINTSIFAIVVIVIELNEIYENKNYLYKIAFNITKNPNIRNSINYFVSSFQILLYK